MAARMKFRWMSMAKCCCGQKKTKVKPFTTERVWHMGILLAAQQFKLDLPNAIVDLPGGKIILHGATALNA